MALQLQGSNVSRRIMHNRSDGETTAAGLAPGLGASVQVLPLPVGLYLFSVTAANPAVARATGQLTLPAVHVGLGPGVPPEHVHFISGPSTHGAWLFAQGDLLVVRISGAGATLILTSVRAPGGEVLSIKVEHLDTRSAALDVAARTGTPLPLKAPPAAAAERSNRAPIAKPGKAAAGAADTLPLQISAHVRRRGDMSFVDVPWAGRVGPGLWIESFSVRPLERFGSDDIEYKGLTSAGFETPWLCNEQMCGTKGMSVPLVGFAVRIKAGASSANYDCEYSGYFQSGQTVGPLRNGAPCRSQVANDPLEGIQVRLVKRTVGTAAAGAAKPSAALRERGRAASHDRNGAASNPLAAAKPKRSAPAQEEGPGRKAEAPHGNGPAARSNRRASANP
jgi:hypothetical protein